MEKDSDLHNINYSELCTLTNKLIESDNKFIVFSVFDDVSYSEDNWIVAAPDITCDKPVIDGDVVFFSDYWRLTDHIEEDEVVSKVYTNPTWKDIINAANEMLEQTCQYSLYFEGIAVRSNGVVKRVKILFGS